MLSNKMTAEEFETRDSERIAQGAEQLNEEACDVLDYQTMESLEFPADAKKRGRGCPRYTS